MRISRSELKRYGDTVAGLGEQAKAYVTTAIRVFLESEPDASPERVREFAIATIKAAVMKYGDASAREAANIYDEIMQREGIDVDSAQIYAGLSDKAVEGTVRRQVGKLLGDDPDVDGFMEQLGKFAFDLTQQAARETVARNVERDHSTRRGRRVRFARVPRRIDPCPWCVMLASRGFDYLSSESAEAGSHHNCTCIMVPGVAGMTTVDGYDPKGMYDRYVMCRKTIQHDISAERRRLLAAGAYDADAFNEWCKRRIVTEMNTRDRHWLATGVPCRRFKERGAHPEKKERDVGTCLLMHGYTVKFARERPPEKRFDAWLNGEAWEFKVPEAYTEKTVKNQFKKALGKGTDKLLISATRNGASLDDLMGDVLALFENGEFVAINEVLLLSADGETLVRIRRPLPDS